MSRQSKIPEHPGSFIRTHVIPAGMSVKDAAKLLRVGRPALSNLVNARSSLSSTMAMKLERTFGTERQKLLDLQAAFDRHVRSQENKAIAARTYVPSFLTIKARQIHEWPEHNHEPRRLLAVLLRKLIHSTGHELRHVDFPAYDNAERKGWDGRVGADAATPWIPEGESGWEFGTNKRPALKAESDYAARLASVSSGKERAECTFVFVTPRNWPGKSNWAKKKDAEGDWKAVLAFDASDLEQWLEESIPAQMWLAEQLGMPTTGFETLDQSWRRWTEASEPKMVRELFEPSITSYHRTFKEWLEKPSETPLTVAADSRDEALAFLACLFRDIATRFEDLLLPSEDLACVFTSVDTLRTLSASSSPFIPIVYAEETERELAAMYRRFHCVIVRPRNAVDSEPDIALDILNHDAFEKALAAMGIRDDMAERLAVESGYSPTILRRRLSKIPAIRKPAWARNNDVARSLIPVALVGAWHSKSSADCEVISTFAGEPYQRTEESIRHLLQAEDCPVWFVGEYRGIVSKIDALFAVSGFLTETDLTEFLWLAEYVLSEIDPALDLPQDKRWAAGLYGKLRDHSAALREGVCETLVILSVHGNNLFGLDDVHVRVSALIQRLLTPLSVDKLLSHDKDLPRYAEAAPREFLRLLEEDLQKERPVVLDLLKPAESLFGRPSRVGLLWALECLAWQHLGRVNVILGQLSRTVIDDNWTNKPIASLEAIYRSWLPQTAASLEERVKALEELTRRFPDIGWQICMAQLQTGPAVGSYSHRPRWRNDASGAGRSVTVREYNDFRTRALGLLLNWHKHDQKTLGDLIERLPGIPEEDHSSVWDLLDEWADSLPDDVAKAELRERIRLFAFTRRSRHLGLEHETRERSRAAYEKLKPADPVIRHAWLFANQWVDPSDEEIEGGDFDYTKHEERIGVLRHEAIEEIWAQRGVDGVRALLSLNSTPYTVGASLSRTVRAARKRADFLSQCLSIEGGLEEQIDGCIHGFLASLNSQAVDAILVAAARGMDPYSIVRLFRCAPFKQGTWRQLEKFSQDILSQYWQEVVPQLSRHSGGERAEIIDRLLEVKRPRAAFYAVHLDWREVETSRLKRLLIAVATVDGEPADWYRPDAYYISKALASLNIRPGISQDEMAQLEFIYISALERSEHGIPNLERQIAGSPILFVQALAWAFDRNDCGQDPQEWRIEDPERRSNMGLLAYRLLERIACIPGTGQDSTVNADALKNWMNEVRRLCADHGRVELGEQRIGQLLAKAPAEEDGSWPCIEVCEAMESIASQQIGNGFQVGVLNGRGVHSRKIDEGGVQERELAAKYRGWARLRAFDYPYVSSLLEDVAADYDRQAGREDDKVKIQRRLTH